MPEKEGGAAVKNSSVKAGEWRMNKECGGALSGSVGPAEPDNEEVVAGFAEREYDGWGEYNFPVNWAWHG